MKTFGIVMGILGAIILSLIVLVVVNYVTYANRGNENDQLIKATYANNQNILGQASSKVMDIMKIADKYTEAVKELTVQALDARYGENGSQAVFQWIQENNPNYDPSAMLKVQQVVESSRDEFKINQTLIIDQCRSYQTDLGYLWAGFWYRLAQYPKIDLATICKPVISSHAEEAFKTKIDNGFIK